MTHAPRITVVSACYNHGKYLADCIPSVTQQRYPGEIEHLIVDDGSTDDSAAVADRMAARWSRPGRTTRVIRQANINQGGARNRGIAESRGDLILCLDSDDVLAPDALMKLVARLEASGADIVTSDVRCFGNSTRIVSFHGGDLAQTKETNGFMAGSLFRRAVWERVGGYDASPSIQGTEDWLFWIDALSVGFRGTRLPQPVFHYRTVAVSQLTKAALRAPQKVAYVVCKHPELYAQDVVSIANRICAREAEFIAAFEGAAPFAGRVPLSDYLARASSAPRRRFEVAYGAASRLLQIGISEALLAFDEAALVAALDPRVDPHAHLAPPKALGLIQRAAWKVYVSVRKRSRP